MCSQVTEWGKGSSLHQCSGNYWNNATIIKGQEGNIYYCKVRLNSFLSSPSFELIFFTLGFFQANMLLEKSWMLSGFGGRQKSQIVVSLIAGQDTANGMNLREGVTRDWEGDCWQVSCISFLVTSKDLLAVRQKRWVESILGFKQKWRMEWNSANSKVVKGPTVQRR